MDYRMKKLFLLLGEDIYRTADELSVELNVSTKTVRNMLKSLNQELNSHGMQVISKYGRGYHIQVDDSEVYGRLRDSTEKEALPDSSGNRVQYILDSLLWDDKYVKIDDLSEELFTTRRTITADLKKAEELLERYHLKLIRKSGYGMTVQGNEINRRLCIANYAEERIHKDRDTTGRIGYGLSEVLKDHAYYLEERVFRTVVVTAYVAMQRLRQGRQADESDVTSEAESHCMEEEYCISREFAAYLRHEFNVDVGRAEIEMAASVLVGALRSEGAGNEAGNVVITQETSDIVSEMLQGVYDSFKIDFRKDLELRMTLCRHLLSLKDRIRGGKELENPILQEVRRRYSFEYTIAMQAAAVLNRIFHTVLSDDEIGYLCFAFALAMERKKTTAVRKNVLLVCGTGHGSAQLLRHQYEQMFGDYINELRTCDVGSLFMADFTDIDYIITTVPISIPVPVLIQEVQFFMTSEDEKNVRHGLERRKEAVIQAYYPEKLFMTHLTFSSREETLEYMCRYLTEKKGLPDDFYTSVIEREALAQTAFGNLAAMPHANRTMGQETSVCVGILDEPVQWGTQKVQVVFLIAVADHELAGEELQTFYRVTTTYLMRGRYIRKLIKEQNYEKFIEDLRELEEQLR